MSTTAKPAMLELLATCTFGLEAVVARELEQMGYAPKPVGTGRVLFAGDHRAVVDANLHLRAADRVLIRLGSFPVGGGDAGFDQLFEGVRAIAWERWIAPTAAFPVSGRCVRSTISSEPAVQRATKRAIVERLKAAYAGVMPREWGGVLPETGSRVSVEVALVNDVATLTLDASGAGLNKRGYRVGGMGGIAGVAGGGGATGAGDAALRETLAAGLVLLSVWRPGRALVDPFCGSGTIAIEAAMIGRNIAPGLRRSFDAEFWLDPAGPPGARLIAAELWSDARADAQGAIRPERLEPVIHASDIDDRALSLARANARAAGVEGDIHFVRKDVQELKSTLEYGVIVTNPPYGVRMGDEREIERLYRSLPRVFRSVPTWSFHIFTGVLDLERFFGQEATRRRKFYNAKIECCYFTFLGPKPPGLHDEPEPAGGFDEGDAEPGGKEDAEVPAPAPRAPARAPAPTFGGLRDRDEREAQEFARCLGNNLRHLRKYPSRGIHCYRVYERDVPDVPLIVDRYLDCFHAVEYERQHSRTAAQQADWFDRMARAIADTAGVPVENVVMKEKHRQRGLSQHERQGELGRAFVVSEGDPALKFEVNLSDYIDTGLFLDHRLTRQMVREQAAGKRFLNLFCYTASFSVYAAAGGAASTTSVDLSNTYLDWGERNMGLNGLLGRAQRFVRSDVLEFLRGHERADPARGAYDLVVIDPPTFSNSKATSRDWVVQDDHVELLRLTASLLSPGGVVFFSNNFRRFKLDEAAVAGMGYRVAELSHRTVPPEYRNRRVHQCWRLVRGGQAPGPQ